VHNAGRTLETCLESIRPHADLIVAVEGRFCDFHVPRSTPHSTDGTVEILKRYADKIIFAEDRPQREMRDLYLVGHRGDYYFVIDGDEELQGDFSKSEIGEAPVWAVPLREPFRSDQLCLRIFQHVPGIHHGPGQLPVTGRGTVMDGAHFPVQVAQSFWLRHLKEERR